MSQNASKTQQKGLPPLQDNTASTPPPPMAINLLTLHVHFRKIAGGYFSKFSCEIFKVVFLFFIYQVMEATKSNWTSLYFVAAYILVNMVIMK